MDEERFATVCRTIGFGATRREAVGAVASLIGVGLPVASAMGALAGDRKGKRKNNKKNKDKDTIDVCHCPSGNRDKCKTLRLAAPEVREHLKHGDTLGPCGSEITRPLESSGMCTPLLQICWPEWLGGNRCCDINADCLYVNADVPAFFCLDQSKDDCKSDIECRSRFTDPNIACMKRFPATCRSGVRQCCQRRTCDVNNQCAGDAVCCNSAASLLQNVCCVPGQTCDPFTGCVTQ